MIALAFHIPGYGWQTAKFASYPAALRWLDRLDDDVAVRWIA
jgi:hypothetical protein